MFFLRHPAYGPGRNRKSGCPSNFSGLWCEKPAIHDGEHENKTDVTGYDAVLWGGNI